MDLKEQALALPPKTGRGLTSFRHQQISYAMKKGQVCRWIDAWESFSGLWRQRLEFRNTRGQGIEGS